MTVASPDLDIRTLIEEIIPFNKLLGVRLTKADVAAGTVTLRMPLRGELIGNVMRSMAHGGAVSALIDAAAGAAAALSLPDLRAAPSVATIDMRVDYLAPGRGEWLEATATVMRSGRRVIVVRVDVSDAQGDLVALGTAAFSVAVAAAAAPGQAAASGAAGSSPEEDGE